MTDFDEQEQESTEITLGTGKLLGMFVGLVAICAIFFSLGYALGKNSGTIQPQLTEAPATIAPGGSTASKPAAGVTATAQPVSESSSPCPEGEPCGATTPPSATVTDSTRTPVETVTEPPAQSQPTPKAQLITTRTVTPDSAPTVSIAKTGASPNGKIVVQVAALGKEQDADTLISSLKKKGFPAFLADAGQDNLFRVQVGPYAERKEANAAKDRLVNDGYHPIVK